MECKKGENMATCNRSTAAILKPELQLGIRHHKYSRQRLLSFNSRGKPIPSHRRIRRRSHFRPVSSLVDTNLQLTAEASLPNEVKTRWMIFSFLFCLFEFWLGDWNAASILYGMDFVWGWTLRLIVNHYHQVVVSAWNRNFHYVGVYGFVIVYG